MQLTGRGKVAVIPDPALTGFLFNEAATDQFTEKYSRAQ